MEIGNAMEELCGLYGPSGFEESAGDTAKRLLAPFVDEVNIDVMGNVIGVKRCGKENAPKLLFDAHIDEIGFIVTGYEEGFLRFASLGGIDARMLPACCVRLMTEPPVFGVIDTMPPHVLKEGETDETIKIDDLFIDVGMTQEEAEKKIPLGTPGVYARSARRLGDDLICSKTLDDRSCFACLVRAAELLKDEDLNADVYYMGSTQEEVGSRGAKTGAFAVDPDYAVIVDVGFASTPDCSTWETKKLGSGCVIGRGPNMNRQFTDRIVKAAEEKGIPYQIGVEPYGHSGTNAEVIQVTREGVATALFSLPLRYMHTPVEVVSLTDAENTAKLLAAAAAVIPEGGSYIA